jgi:hypothetical protein
VARGSNGLTTGVNVREMVSFGRSNNVALDATIEGPAANTRELFDLLARGVRQGGKLERIDLGVMETDIQGDGTVLINFSNDQQLGLDAFIREAQSRGLLAPGAVVRVPVDKHETNEVGRFFNWAVGVTANTGVGIEAYARTGQTHQRGMQGVA